METDIIIATAALIVSLSGFAWSLYERLRLEKKKLAIEMLKDWNNSTSKDTSIIRKYYDENYNNCTSIEKEEVENIIHSDGLSTIENAKYPEIKAAIISLLNYFEYVAAAYNRRSVDKKIIRNSFSVTMLRFYIVLRNFKILYFKESSRNHWRPFTKHLRKLLKKRKKLICAGCKSVDCILKPDQHNSLTRLIKLFNKGKLSTEEISEMQDFLTVNNKPFTN